MKLNREEVKGRLNKAYHKFMPKEGDIFVTSTNQSDPFAMENILDELFDHIEAQKKRLSALTYIANTSKDENKELKKKLEVSDQENFDLRKGLEPTFSDLVGELDNLKAKLEAIESNKVAEFNGKCYSGASRTNLEGHLVVDGISTSDFELVNWTGQKETLTKGETYTVTISKETK